MEQAGGVVVCGAAGVHATREVEDLVAENGLFR